MNWEDKVNDLRVKRDKLGLNNNQISLLTGLDRSSLGRFFNGDNEPRLGLYLIVKDFLNNYKDAEKVEVVDVIIEKPKESFKVKKDYVVGVIDVDAEKKAKIAMLKEIASGNVPKVSDSFIIDKKLPLEERYDFEYPRSLPDFDSQVIIGTKGVAFFDRYDNSFFYVKYQGKTLKFSDRKEFDKFVKQEGILL